MTTSYVVEFRNPEGWHVSSYSFRSMFAARRALKFYSEMSGVVEARIVRGEQGGQVITTWLREQA